MPSFQQVMRAAADAYRTRREQVASQAQRLAGSRWGRPGHGDLGRGAPAHAPVLRRRGRRLRRQPKFPQPMTLDFALTQYTRTGDLDALWMVELTLEKMAHGGIYDQLGGGFHRYSDVGPSELNPLTLRIEENETIGLQIAIVRQ